MPDTFFCKISPTSISILANVKLKWSLQAPKITLRHPLVTLWAPRVHFASVLGSKKIVPPDPLNDSQTPPCEPLGPEGPLCIGFGEHFWRRRGR